MRRDFKGGGRLEFERDLMAEIARPSSPRRHIGRLVRVVLMLAIVASVLAVAAYGVTRLASFWPGHRVPLMRTGEALSEALRSGNMAGALKYCADSPEGQLLLAQDNARVWNEGSEPVARAESPSSAEFLIATHAKLLVRPDLAGLRPLAFGGARATILDPDRMAEPAIALTGDLYLAVGEEVYVLELTMRECAGQYVVTDFSNCAPVDTTPDTIEQTAASRFRAFQEEKAKMGESAEILRAKHVFVTFDAP